MLKLFVYFYDLKIRNKMLVIKEGGESNLTASLIITL
jgi:hypothetical protein